MIYEIINLLGRHTGRKYQIVQADGGINYIHEFDSKPPLWIQKLVIKWLCRKWKMLVDVRREDSIFVHFNTKHVINDGCFSIESKATHLLIDNDYITVNFVTNKSLGFQETDSITVKLNTVQTT